MITENLTLSEFPKDINKIQSISPNIKYRTNTFNLFKDNSDKNNNNLIKTQPNQEKDKTFFNKNITVSNNNNSMDHPLVFYALGKINESKIENKTIPLYTSQGFRSHSNDLIKRNILSYNSTFFDNLKNKKQNNTINHKIIEENDYLNPIKIYKSFHKYIPNKNCENQETYNLAKKKMYSRDIFSNIKKGMYISKNEFMDQKNRLINEKTKIKKPKIKIQNSLDDSKFDDNKKHYISSHTENNDKFIFKDPIDHTREDLKSKDWRFDRNYKKFIKHKNWWKSDK